MNRTPSKRVFITSMVILAVMYSVFGLVSWVNAILIPYFRIILELKSNTQSYLVTFAFYIAYFVMAIPSGLLLNRVGYKRGIMYGFICLAIGALIFVPAAIIRQYWLFLIGLYCIGTGLAILQTAANPYVTIIGPIESAARRMSIMGVFNKSAGILAPLVFSAVVLEAVDSTIVSSLEAGILAGMEKEMALQQLTQALIPPYAILAAILLVVGIAIRFSVLPEIEPEEEADEDMAVASKATTKADLEHPKDIKKPKRLIDYPYLIFGALAIFLHVGTQVISIDTIINYAGGMGIGLIDAKVFPSYTLTCTIISYMLGIILIPRLVSQKTALRFCSTLGLILSLGVVLLNFSVSFLGHSANISIWLLASIGFANALIYAGIWPLSIHGLGKLTKTGSSLLIMGLSGNAILPLIYGAVADVHGLRAGYWVLVPCFLYIMWFAFRGHKIKSWKRVKPV
ncbi:MAG: sugar MFS transporter [Fermentimonas sp.]|jgi:FHS family L-fucose permease-like MFS transporter